MTGLPRIPLPFPFLDTVLRSLDASRWSPLGTFPHCVGMSPRILGVISFIVKCAITPRFLYFLYLFIPLFILCLSQLLKTDLTLLNSSSFAGLGIDPVCSIPRLNSTVGGSKSLGNIANVILCGISFFLIAGLIAMAWRRKAAVGEHTQPSFH